MSGWLRFLCVVVLLTAARAGEWPELAAGRDVTVPWDGLKNPLRVRLPDDFAVGRKWPVVFHYHGSGGQPTIDIPLRYTDGKGFVLVGMEYITRDLPAATPDYLEREWAVLLAVRTELAGVVTIDPQRTYVGGFSQGGWFASEFMEVHGGDLAGAYVLGAGKRPRNKRDPKPFGGARPVYLGAGQLDPNSIYALQGLKHFGALGAVATFEDFLAMGHQMPMGGRSDPLAPGLRQWFRIEEARGHPTDGVLKAEVDSWRARVLDRATSDGDPLRRWLRLSRAKKAPFFDHLTRAAQRQVTDLLTATEKSLPLEMEARARYFTLIEAELAGAKNGDLWRFFREQAVRYHAAWQTAPTTYHGRRAAMEFSRLRGDLNAVDRWRFPDEAARERALDDAARHPLPEPPPAELKQQFAAWRLEIDGDPEPAPPLVDHSVR